MTVLENTSAHSVTIPGAVNAWETLLKAHGRKGLDELLRPAIQYAEDGWPVHPKVSWDWARSMAKLRKGGSAHFLPDGEAPKAGDVFAQPALAETLRAISRHGAKAFYEGSVAADIVATLRARGGLHTEEDFARGLHNAEFVEPITLNWKGYDVYQCPPNGQGLLVLMILGMLGGLPSAPDGASGVVRAHRHIEAARLAYRDRDAFLADPGAVDVPVKKLLSAEYLAAQRALISDTAAMPVLPAPGESVLPPHKDTVYLCVVDKDGNACSFINSLFQNFGSGILAHDSGVMLQNRGFGFRLQRGHPNCIAGGQAPDAHHHSGHADEGRARGDAVRGDGRPLPADGAVLVPDQFPGIRARHPAVDRFVPDFPNRRKVAGGARCAQRFGAQAGRDGPCSGDRGASARRRTGDLDRP